MYSFSDTLKPPRLTETERKRIRQEIREYRTADDVIAGMFSFLRTERIPLDVKRIHSAMYRISKEFPGMLEEFIFSRNDVYPFSRLLETVLFRLQNSSLISTINPDFKVCIVPAEAKEFVRKNILPSFNDKEQRDLKKMAQRFELLVGKV